MFFLAQLIEELSVVIRNFINTDNKKVVVVSLQPSLVHGGKNCCTDHLTAPVKYAFIIKQDI
jgi:hypothetical protein